MKRLVFLAASAALLLSAQDAGPQQRMLRWMDGIAQQQLDRREAEIGKIRTTSDAERRKEFVRAKALELLGGMPDYSGPLNPRVTGTLRHNGYVIEKVIFESLPQFYITANVYKPSQPGRYPGILLPLGHWDEGKPGPQRIAANLALKGFVVLVYDPIGQGERLAAYDSRVGNSLAGGSTDQHFMAGAQSLLANESFAKYRIWDGKRAIDYLVSRPDVDADRIGCTGCSGGGTLTTFISALDPRVKVAAPACYMNSFRVLFSGSVGDSEQSLPNFLSSGLDQTDFVELFSPKPWLISSTVNDFFKIEGAREVYEEAKKWYRLYGAEDKVHWEIGPGEHGTPVQIREAIYAWFIRWLKDGKGDPREQEVELHPEFELRVTKSGQVSTELKSREIYEIIRDGARKRQTPGSQQQMLEAIRQWAAPSAEVKPAARILDETLTAGMREQRIKFETEPGLEILGTLLIPRKEGRKPAALVVDSDGRSQATARQLADAGAVVLLLSPRDMPYDSTEYRALGDWSGATRAWLIGRNLAGMRALDIRHGIDLLAAMPDVDSANIKAAARNVAGVWLLMAAAIDPRIKAIWLDRTPYSLWKAMDNPLHKNLHEAILPGFILHWDLQDMVKAIAPRAVIWTDPTDWMGSIMPIGAPYRFRPWEGTDEPYIDALMRQ